MIKLPLTEKQAIALDNLATVSKMDCWFYITQEVNGHFVIRDLENKMKKMNTSNAIEMLLDGMTDLDFQNLDNENKPIISEMWKQIYKN